MNYFDKAVNDILKKILSENVEFNFKNVDDIVNSKIKEITKRVQMEGESFRAESESKYLSGQELVNKFVENLKQIAKNINKTDVQEESFIETAKNALDVLQQGGSELWSKISPEIANTQEFLADLAVENIGAIVRDTIGDSYVDEIREQLSESMIYKIIAILEPTGVMSWPYLANAKKNYEDHIGTEEEGIYQLNLLAAQISVIPGVRVPLAILTLPFRLVFGLPARILGKIFGISGLRRIGLALTEKIRLPFTKSASVKKGADVLKNAPSNTKIGKLAKIPASNAIKKLPDKIKPISSNVKPASKKVLDAVKKGVKTGVKTVPVAAKTGTILTSGDIPEGIKDLMKPPKNNKPSAPKVSTLGRFPNFSSLSTQSF